MKHLEATGVQALAINRLNLQGYFTIKSCIDFRALWLGSPA